MPPGEFDAMMQQLNKYEAKRMGGFMRICPAEDDLVDYQPFLAYARTAWDNETGASKRPRGGGDSVDTTPHPAQRDQGRHMSSARTQSIKSLRFNESGVARKGHGSRQFTSSIQYREKMSSTMISESRLKYASETEISFNQEKTATLPLPLEGASEDQTLNKSPDFPIQSRTSQSASHVPRQSTNFDLTKSSRNETAPRGHNPSFSFAFDNIMTFLRGEDNKAVIPMPPNHGHDTPLLIIQQVQPPPPPPSGPSKDWYSRTNVNYFVKPQHSHRRVPLRARKTEMGETGEGFRMTARNPSPHTKVGTFVKHQSAGPLNEPQNPPLMKVSSIVYGQNAKEVNQNLDLQRLRLIINRRPTGTAPTPPSQHTSHHNKQNSTPNHFTSIPDAGRLVSNLIVLPRKFQE